MSLTITIPYPNNTSPISFFPFLKMKVITQAGKQRRNNVSTSKRRNYDGYFDCKINKIVALYKLR